MHTSNLYHNLWTGALCKLLVETTLAAGAFASASRVFVCNSGSEANEAALKFARKVGKTFGGESKTGLVSFHGSFHGRTMGSLSATPNPKYQKPFAPMVPGFRYGVFNDVAGIAELVDETTCGVIVEPIQGEGGVNVATVEFMITLARRCREVGAVLIYDEIQVSVSLLQETKLTRVVRTRTDGRFVGASILAGGGPSGCVDDGEGARERLPGRGNDGE